MTDQPRPGQPARVTPAEISRSARPGPRPAALRVAGRPDRLARAQSRSCSPGSPPTSTHPRPMRSPPGPGTSYAPWPPSCAARWTEARPDEPVPVLRRADRPGHQPRPVRQASAALPGAAHPGVDDRLRAAAPAAVAPDQTHRPASRRQPHPRRPGPVLARARLARPRHHRRRSSPPVLWSGGSCGPRPGPGSSPGRCGDGCAAGTTTAAGPRS